MIKKAIIAAPFGVYLKTNWATSVRGTYTINPRTGVIVQSLKTFRKVNGGWVNRMGFRNKGILSEYQHLADARDYINDIESETIWSIGAAENDDEWEHLFLFLKDFNRITVELNLGCHNVNQTVIDDSLMKSYVNMFENIIVKLPSELGSAYALAERCYHNGVRTFHFCNTLKTEAGAESSRRIQDVAIPLITEFKKHHYDVGCIAGGGIYAADDVKRYRDAGADYFSLATVFLQPWKIPSVLKEIYTGG